MLNLARLRVLEAAARTGSLTAAAAELSYTTSAVSQQIAALERDTGARLLERHPRGVRLTEAGRVLVAHTGTVIAELQAAEDELAAVRRGRPRAGPGAGLRVLAGAGRRAGGRRGARAAAGPRLHHDARVAPAGAAAAVAAGGAGRRGGGPGRAPPGHPPPPA